MGFGGSDFGYRLTILEAAVACERWGGGEQRVAVALVVVLGPPRIGVSLYMECT